MQGGRSVRVEILLALCNPISRDVAPRCRQVERTRTNHFVESFFQGVLNVRIPRPGRGGFRP